jgi:Fe-S cluster assembly protein SufD
MTTEMTDERSKFLTQLEREYQEIAPGDSLGKLRAKAWERFLEIGLPSKSMEQYRYIRVRPLLDQTYGSPDDSEITADMIERFILPECRHSHIIFLNGRFQPKLSQVSGLPSGLVITSLPEAMKTFGTFITNQWTKSLKEESDPFAALNAALHLDGAFIYVPPKMIVENPIQVLYITSCEQPAIINPRLHLFAGAHSQLQIITTQTALSSQSSFLNQTTEFSIEDGAQVHHTQISLQSDPSAWHFDAVRTSLKRNSSFKCVMVTEGSTTVRHDYRMALTGENAEALLNGVWMLDHKHESHVNILIDHQAPHCRSMQLFKGALNDFSRSSFEGKIYVHQAAQKTEAFQLNNNLLLSDRASADSKPNLEIFADDVKASHGATFGTVDAEQLFYLQTRGVPDRIAKSLLTYGFCKEVLDLIPHASLIESLSHRAQRYLDQLA